VRITSLTLAVATAIGVVGSAAPQFRASVDVVRMEALVLDGGKPVRGLTARDFAVTDQGIAQAVEVGPLTGQPIDVAIVVDVSSSVRGSQLERLRAAARALVGLLTPRDRATLVTFDHLVTLGPRDGPPAGLEPQLTALEAGGGTALVDAVTTALAWSAGRDRPMLVLVFSDGLDTASWTRLDQALALARRSDAVVDAVVTGALLPTSTARVGADLTIVRATPSERFLSELAELTGGHVRNGGSGAGLAGAFRAALEQFRGRYEITYTATTRDPGWHAIEVRVPGRRGVTVHARRGYQR
jgi:VWFA-related protein